MKSPCIGCEREHKDKNACVQTCNKLLNFQQENAGVIVGSVSSHQCMMSYVSGTGCRVVYPKPPHY